MLLKLKSEKLKYGFVIIVTLVSLRFWSFEFVDEKLYNISSLIILGLLLSIVIYNLSIFSKEGLKFKTNILLFIFLPLLSVIGANLYHDQSFDLSLLQSRFFLFWFFYFVLHIFNISQEKIIKLLVFVGCVWIFLTIVQQFTYPNYYFFTRSDDSQTIFRAGVYRYMVLGELYGLFVLFYFFYKYLIQKRVYSLVFVVLALVGLYYYGTRQVAVAAIICLFIAVLLLKNISKWKYLLLMSFAVLLVIGFFSLLFQDYVDMTTSQLDDENYIRILSANFYLNEYWPHWGAKLLGNGMPHHRSEYGAEMDIIQNYLRYWRADVGIIGTYNQFGIFLVLNILWVNLKVFFLKFKNENDKYLKLFFFYFTILLLLSQSFTNGNAIPFYCLVFYLIDKSLERKNEPFLVFNIKRETELSI